MIFRIPLALLTRSLPTFCAVLLITGLCATPLPDAFEELASQAATARAANDISKAIELYKRALDLRPGWIEGWWFLGTLSYDSDQYAGGKDALSHLVQLLDVRGAPALAMLGLCEYSTGDYAHALDHIQNGLKISNGKLETSMEAVARFHEALLLTKTGFYDSSLQHLFPFARAHSADTALTMALGLASLRLPLVPEEVSRDRRDLVAEGGNATYLWMKGAEHAEDEMKALVAKYPNTPNVHFLYGSYLVDRRADDAIAEFRQELRVDPLNPAAQAMLALQLYRVEKFDEAWSYANQSIEATDKLPKGQLALGLLLTRRGQTGDGIGHLRTACELEPGDFECHAALATAYSRLGRAEDARSERFASMQLAKESGSSADH
jgi:tetratricopeptide (TPR) repeat protein